MSATNGTGEHRIVAAPIEGAGEPESAPITVKIPKDWGKLIPWFFAALFGGDRLLSEYIKAPDDIREIKEEVQEINKKIAAIEAALQIPAKEPVK